MYKPKFIIEKEDLYKLYRVEKKSTLFIAKIYNCNHDTISGRLREFNIPIRSKYKISKKALLKLYLKENKSPAFIGKLYGCSFATVRNRLKKYGIPKKSKSLAQMRYTKYDFFGDIIEKAYLIGFRLGDLNVYKTSENAETVIVRCHTTCLPQIELMKNIFGKYGHVTSNTRKDGGTDVNCYFNKTFEFLLPKSDIVEKWIIDDEKCFRAFAAGYIDAEGTFGVYQERGRFKIDSYDKEILFQIHNWLDRNKISSKFFRVQLQGDFLSGYRMNKDVYRVNVNGANDLLKFIGIIKPFLKHGKRVNDMEKVIENIKRRKLKRTIK